MPLERDLALMSAGLTRNPYTPPRSPAFPRVELAKNIRKKKNFRLWPGLTRLSDVSDATSEVSFMQGVYPLKSCEFAVFLRRF
jgi:hypothetical protein